MFVKLLKATVRFVMSVRMEQLGCHWINYCEMGTTGEKEKRASKKNVGGRSTSNHDIQRPRTRAMEKQRGMAFGFRKTAAAVKQTG